MKTGVAEARRVEAGQVGLPADVAAVGEALMSEARGMTAAGKVALHEVGVLHAAGMARAERATVTGAERAIVPRAEKSCVPRAEGAGVTGAEGAGMAGAEIALHEVRIAVRKAARVGRDAAPAPPAFIPPSESSRRRVLRLLEILRREDRHPRIRRRHETHLHHHRGIRFRHHRGIHLHRRRGIRRRPRETHFRRPRGIHLRRHEIHHRRHHENHRRHRAHRRRHVRHLRRHVHRRRRASPRRWSTKARGLPRARRG